MKRIRADWKLKFWKPLCEKTFGFNRRIIVPTAPDFSTFINNEKFHVHRSRYCAKALEEYLGGKLAWVFKFRPFKFQANIKKLRRRAFDRLWRARRIQFFFRD